MNIKSIPTEQLIKELSLRISPDTYKLHLGALEKLAWDIINESEASHENKPHRNGAQYVTRNA